MNVNSYTYRFALLLMRQLIVADADDEIDVGKDVFCLVQLLRVAVMEQVVNTVGEYAHGPTR